MHRFSYRLWSFSLACLSALLGAIAPVRAQQAQALPLDLNDVPALLDITGARQKVVFAEPVYARMWIDVTQANVTRTRTELLLTQASDTITLKALLLRRDVPGASREPADNNRIKLEMQTPVSEAEPNSFTLWTNSEGTTFPPLPTQRPSAVNVTVRCPAERPLENDAPILVVEESIRDSNGLVIDSRRTEVKVRFSKTPFRPQLR